MTAGSRHRANTVILSAWVDPALRDHAREAAKDAGVPFSEFIEHAVRRAVFAASMERVDHKIAKAPRPKPRG